MLNSVCVQHLTAQTLCTGCNLHRSAESVLCTNAGLAAGARGKPQAEHHPLAQETMYKTLRPPYVVHHYQDAEHKIVRLGVQGCWSIRSRGQACVARRTQGGLGPYCCVAAAPRTSSARAAAHPGRSRVYMGAASLPFLTRTPAPSAATGQHTCKFTTKQKYPCKPRDTTQLS